MYDFLIAADLMVPDPDAHAALLVDKLGVFAHPRWRQGFDTHNYVAHFLRVNRSLAVAPTRLEPQHYSGVDNPVDPAFLAYLDSLEQFQGPSRPIKTHACTVAYDQMDELIERLSRRRVPFRVAPLDETLWFERVWLGCTPEDPKYTPVVDGGLCLEFHSWRPLQMPPEAFAVPPPVLQDPQSGEMVRITARSFLVRDLDATLRLLSTNLEWEPAGPVESFQDEGIRRARMGFALSHSATVDLIEPTRWDGDAGRFLHTWGPGPYYVRIAVNGLEAKADDLASRGTRSTWLPESPVVGGARIRVDPTELQGTLVEFVENVTPFTHT